ncbi:hypothetical protein JV46_29430 [Solemya velum gill symbiont]|uniref:Uncharacterized protein n=1 Tax=Solemya velum gill symbiont TaxID=2340 RepID=A0A0B0H4G8_SOVGS|nr:hypothetical protein JV46_29430 [Solemya velum gill symbiont]
MIYFIISLDKPDSILDNSYILNS